MAYLGLKKPIIGKMKETGGYNDPFACGKAIGITVTPNYVEGSLYGDDVQDEYDKLFTNAEVTLNTTTLPIKAHTEMFGNTIGNNSETEVVSNTDDEASYVGMGFISTERVDKKRKFCGNFIPKVKFSEPNGDYATRGENIEYKTPSVSGKALAMDNGDWKYTDIFDTEREALNYVYKKFGYELEELKVVSAEGTNKGETQLTVTPEKDGENVYFYKTGKNVTMPAYNEVCNGLSGWTSWNGSSAIKAATGDKIVVAEVTSQDYYARKAGEATVTAKAEG